MPHGVFASPINRQPHSRRHWTMLVVPEPIALQFFRMELVTIPTLSLLIAVMPPTVTIKGRAKLKDLATSPALPKSLKPIQVLAVDALFRLLQGTSGTTTTTSNSTSGTTPSTTFTPTGSTGTGVIGSLGPSGTSITSPDGTNGGKTSKIHHSITIMLPFLLLLLLRL